MKNRDAIDVPCVSFTSFIHVPSVNVKYKFKITYMDEKVQMEKNEHQVVPSIDRSKIMFLLM
jgi:hypothetical protein